MLVGGDGGYSGVPAHLRQLVRALHETARITVVADRNRGGYDFVQSIASGTDLRLVEIPGLRSSPNPLAAWCAAQALRRLVAEDPADLVWAHARMAVLLTRLMPPGCPLAVTLHGLPFGPGHRQPFATLSAWLERGLLRFGAAHRVVLLSEAARSRYVARMGQRALRRHALHVIENCSDLDPLPPVASSADTVRLLMTGRAGYQKNYGFAAQVMAHLPERFSLTICGTGTDTVAFRVPFDAALGAETCARRVRFLGPVMDVSEQLARSDVFLLTSRYEGMPIGALEAMQAGLPVALTRIDGTEEILARHPAAEGFALNDPASAAASIQELAALICARPDLAQDIHAAWAKWFSFAAWSIRASDLLDDMRAPL